MEPIEVAHRYFDAWNARDPEGVAACFAPGGTYTDPTTPPVTGQAIAEMVRALLVMVPDLSFDVVSSAQLPDGSVAGQWIMRGTNTGPLPGGPPLGKTIALPGADFIEVDGELVRSVTGYFDMKTMFEQLGLAVTPMPAEAIGPFSFGGGAHASMGSAARPGAFSITVLHTRSDEERERVQEISQNVMMDMLGMRGFIGVKGLTFGHLMTTVTAWEDLEGSKQLYDSRAHKEGVRMMFEDDFSDGGMLSVWQPASVRMLARCGSCGKLAEVGEDAAACPACGADLRPHCVYF